MKISQILNKFPPETQKTGTDTGTQKSSQSIPGLIPGLRKSPNRYRYRYWYYRYQYRTFWSDTDIRACLCFTGLQVRGQVCCGADVHFDPDRGSEQRELPTDHSLPFGDKHWLVLEQQQPRGEPLRPLGIQVGRIGGTRNQRLLLPGNYSLFQEILWPLPWQYIQWSWTRYRAISKILTLGLVENHFQKGY